MADLLLSFLACYGVAFFFQNKMWRPAKLHWIIEKLLSCIYCLGFWSGLIFFIVRTAVVGIEEPLFELILSGLTFGFASSVFCYTVDTAVQWFEENR